MPGNNDTGTNTAISTSDVAMTALVTSVIAISAALRAFVDTFFEVALDVLDDHDRIVHHKPSRQA